MRKYFQLGLLCSALGLAIPGAQAELLRVEQSILGMDCAPCAYGMEQGLGDLNGVTRVSVSLDQMQATLQLAPENALTLQAIREVIVNGGFKPTQARIQVVGTLKGQGRRMRLVAGENMVFTLTPAKATPAAWAELQQWDEEKRVLVKGQVAHADRLSVIAVSPTPDA